jgi:tetratricopeptide (TPR) repeat protein
VNGRATNSRVLLIEARRLLESAVKQRPDNDRYLELLGEICLVSGDSLAAIPHLEQALAVGREPRASWLLGWAYVHAGRLADVERLVREQIEAGHGCARALYVRGLARFRRRAFELAIEDLRAAMPDESDVPFFRRELARALIGAAIQGATPAFGVRPATSSHRPQYLTDAVGLLRSGDHDDASSAAERAYLIGCALLELGEWTRALSVLADTDYPSRPEASFRRGIAAARESDVPTARACFVEARESGELAAASDAAIAALLSRGHLDGVPLSPPPIAPVGLGPLSGPMMVPLVVRGEGWPASRWPTAAREAPADWSPEGIAEPEPLACGDPAKPIGALEQALRERRFDPETASECVAVIESGDIDGDLRRRALLALAVALRVDLKRPHEEVARVVPLLHRLRAVAPGLAFVRLHLGRYHFRHGEYARAVEEIAGIGGGLARRPEVQNVLARSSEKLGRFDDVERFYRASLAGRIDQPTISYALGRLLLAVYRDRCAASSSAS